MRVVILGVPSRQVTKAQWAHREFSSLKCSWGKEVLNTPQGGPLQKKKVREGPPYYWFVLCYYSPCTS